MNKPTLFMTTKKSFLMLMLAFLLSQVPFICFSQESSPDGGSSALLKDSMDDFSMVLTFGGGGAVLGLSTLSFSKQPLQSLNNILIGASLGVIVGVAVVAWNQASRINQSAGTTAAIALPPAPSSPPPLIAKQMAQDVRWDLFHLSYSF